MSINNVKVINSQLLLYLNLGLGLLLVLYFVLGRPKPRQPTKLNLKAKPAGEGAVKAALVLPPEEAMARSSVSTTLSLQSNTDVGAAPSTRQLSILFMYNGHDWEAHQVLGVPQGASMHMVTEAYQKLIVTADVNSLSFYESAYNAITEKHRKHRL